MQLVAVMFPLAVAVVEVILLAGWLMMVGEEQ